MSAAGISSGSLTLMVSSDRRGIGKNACTGEAAAIWHVRVSISLSLIIPICNFALAQNGTAPMTNERFVSSGCRSRGRRVQRGLVALVTFFRRRRAPGSRRGVHTTVLRVFYWFYNYGWMGVEFFFALSGFIFFHYYYGLIQDRRIGAGEFFKRRFARLYPLHGLTMLIVIVLQEIYRQQHGSNFVYPPGTPADLFQAVTLTSHWWPNQEFFFNGPSWSISVECFL